MPLKNFSHVRNQKFSIDVIKDSVEKLHYTTKLINHI